MHLVLMQNQPSVIKVNTENLDDEYYNSNCHNTYLDPSFLKYKKIMQFFIETLDLYYIKYRLFKRAYRFLIIWKFLLKSDENSFLYLSLQ